MIPKCPEQNNVTLRDLTGHYKSSKLVTWESLDVLIHSERRATEIKCQGLSALFWDTPITGRGTDYDKGICRVIHSQDVRFD